MPFVTPDWPAPAGVRACVTTRDGGTSLPPYASLNLATHVGDDPAAVAHNRRRLEKALALPSSPRWLSQVHGTQCVDAATAVDDVEADAAFTTRAGVVCAILTADCLPVLLCNREGTRVAAVHAGWRGLYGGVLPAAVRALAVAPDTLLAWVGPGIGVDAYAVGASLRAQFIAQDATLADCFERRADAWHANLGAIAAHQLVSAGVPAIHRHATCTFEDARFYSYRRDGVTGRFASLIWIKSDALVP